MPTVSPFEEIKLCQCAWECGEYAKPGKKFIVGHVGRRIKKESKLCECKCTQYANAGKRFVIVLIVPVYAVGVTTFVKAPVKVLIVPEKTNAYVWLKCSCRCNISCYR